MPNIDSNVIVIKNNLKVGELEAETDTDLLNTCFIDKGDIEILSNVSKPACIILGRTGSGKSALLHQISKTVSKSKTLDPHDISISFLEHSNIIQFFTELGVKIDLFYRFLWRHVLTIELLKMRYDTQGPNIFERLWGLVQRDPAKEEALSYFKEWGDKFWLETQEQLKQVTEKVEENIKSSFETSKIPVNISLSGAKSISTEDRAEYIALANRVVSQIQISKLKNVLDLLEEKVFNDDQKTYFIQLDKLDEDWADTETRCHFIRALIEEIKTFRKIRNVKIIVAMRKDLLEMVFDKTRNSGFQQEKYESYIYQIVWTKNELKSLIDKRINEVFKRQYTKNGFSFDNIFTSPKKGAAQTAIDYILERTFLRPRDVMQFVNECFILSIGKNKVSWNNIYAAESSYSQKRLKSLFEEWSEVFPSLEKSIDLIRRTPISLKRSDLEGKRFNSVVTSMIDAFDAPSDDPCVKAVMKHSDPGSDFVTEDLVISEFIGCFYRIGAVGVKLSEVEKYIWSDQDKATLTKGDIERVDHIKIHKMLHRSLGTQEHTYL